MIQLEAIQRRGRLAVVAAASAEVLSRLPPKRRHGVPSDSCTRTQTRPRPRCVLLGLAALLSVASGCASERRTELPGRIEPPARSVSQPSDAPAAAPVRPVVDDYHGFEVVDPYRYMEDLDDPEVQAWIRAQADHAAATLGAVSGRERLRARITDLDQGAPYRIGGVTRRPDGTWYYWKRAAGDSTSQFYRRDPDGTDTLLIDPRRFDHGDVRHTLNFARPSPDGRHVAYGVSASGSEDSSLRILDVITGHDLPEVIDRLEYLYTPPMWLPDSSGLFYCRMRALPAGAPPTEAYKRTQALLHRLGTTVAEDRLLMEMGASPNVPLEEIDYPSVVVRPGSPFAVLKIQHGDATELSLYAAPLQAVVERGPGAPWRPICGPADGVSRFTVHDEDVYLLTAHDAPRYRVVRTSLADPDLAAAVEVVPQSAAVIEWVSVAADALYVESLDAGRITVRRVAFDGPGAVEPVRPPVAGTSMFVTSVNPLVPGVLLGTTAWTGAGLDYAYDPAEGSLTELQLEPRGAHDDPGTLTAVEVEVPSHDGVMVPLSIVHRRGLTLDGSNPTILYGYGAYGISMGTYYDPINLAWFERGGVLAIAHVRGGGEKGIEWHHAGRKGTKPNTWKDFIACAEYLVREGYTTPAQLAGEGGSAGAIMVGRAITERPDLFGAALIHVGCLDMLRFETTTNGVPNIPENGSTATPDGFRALLAMSPYHHVRDGERYPAVLLTHGINDPRVEPWLSAKMTARLQAASSSDKPILLRVDYQGGHGIGSTRQQKHDQQADLWAFLLWQFGDPEFRPEGR